MNKKQKKEQKIFDSPLDQKIYQASGQVEYADKLVEFLYTLMRDKLPVGDVAEIVRECRNGYCKYANGYLAETAKILADELRN